MPAVKHVLGVAAGVAAFFLIRSMLPESIKAKLS